LHTLASLCVCQLPLPCASGHGAPQLKRDPLGRWLRGRRTHVLQLVGQVVVLCGSGLCLCTQPWPEPPPVDQRVFLSEHAAWRFQAAAGGARQLGRARRAVAPERAANGVRYGLRIAHRARRLRPPASAWHVRDDTGQARVLCGRRRRTILRLTGRQSGDRCARRATDRQRFGVPSEASFWVVPASGSTSLRTRFYVMGPRYGEMLISHCVQAAAGIRTPNATVDASPHGSIPTSARGKTPHRRHCRR